MYTQMHQKVTIYIYALRKYAQYILSAYDHILYTSTKLSGDSWSSYVRKGVPKVVDNSKPFHHPIHKLNMNFFNKLRKLGSIFYILLLTQNQNRK